MAYLNSNHQVREFSRTIKPNKSRKSKIRSIEDDRLFGRPILRENPRNSAKKKWRKKFLLKSKRLETTSRPKFTNHFKCPRFPWVLFLQTEFHKTKEKSPNNNNKKNQNQNPAKFKEKEKFVSSLNDLRPLSSARKFHETFPNARVSTGIFSRAKLREQNKMKIRRTNQIQRSSEKEKETSENLSNRKPHEKIQTKFPVTHFLDQNHSKLQCPRIFASTSACRIQKFRILPSQVHTQLETPSWIRLSHGK